jgi:hypothetical protein
MIYPTDHAPVSTCIYNSSPVGFARIAHNTPSSSATNARRELWPLHDLFAILEGQQMTSNILVAMVKEIMARS